ncbi:hypothetical protein JKP88DRAFT_320213, partial [Tribonema minus]
VRARHILVKHQRSRNPTSFRDRDGAGIRARTRAAAAATLQQLASQLGDAPSEADFAKAAADVSDCSSAKRGGDLGVFARGKMQPAFEAAAFELRRGGMSGVVDTDSGCHLIFRTE